MNKLPLLDHYLFMLCKRKRPLSWISKVFVNKEGTVLLPSLSIRLPSHRICNFFQFGTGNLSEMGIPR